MSSQLDLCSLVDAVSPETRKLVVQLALERKLEELQREGDYLAAIELVRRAAEKGYIPREEAERLERILGLYYALSDAAHSVEMLFRLMPESLSSPDRLDLLIYEARRALEELEKAYSQAGSLVGEDVRSRVEETEKYLRDLIRLGEYLKKVARVLPEFQAKVSRLKELLEELQKASTGMSSASGVWRVKEVFDQIASELSATPDVPVPPAFETEEVAGVAEKLQAHLAGLKSLLIGFSQAAREESFALAYLYSLLNTLDKIARGELNPSDPTVVSSVETLASAVLSHSRRASDIMWTVYRGVASAVRELEEFASALVDVVESTSRIARRIVEEAYKAVAPYNKDLADAFRKAFEENGYTPPRVEMGVAGTIEQAINTLLSRMHWAGEILAKVAGRSSNPATKMAANLGSIIEFAGYYLVGALTSLLQIQLMRLNQLKALVHGDIRKALEEELTLLKSMIPKPRSWQEAVGLLLSLALLAELARRLPVVRRAIAITTPELELAARLVGGILGRVGRATLEEFGRVRARVRVTLDEAENIAEALREELLSRIGRRDIAEFIAEAARRLARSLAREKATVAELERSLSRLVEEEGTLNVKVSMSELSTALSRLLSRLHVTAGEALRSFVKGLAEISEASRGELKASAETASRMFSRVIPRIEEVYKEARELLEDIRRNEKVLRALVGDKADQIIASLERAVERLENIRSVMETAKKLADALAEASRELSPAYARLSELARELGEGRIAEKLARMKVRVDELPRIAAKLIDKVYARGVEAYSEFYRALNQAAKALERVARLASTAGLPATGALEVAVKLRKLDSEVAARLAGRVKVLEPEEIARLAPHLAERLKGPISLEDLAKLLEEAEEARSLAYIQEALRVLREAAGRLSSLARELPEGSALKKLVVKSLEEVEAELRSLEARFRSIEERYAGVKAAVDTLARLAEEAGWRDVAETLRKAWMEMPDVGKAAKLLEKAARMVESKIRTSKLSALKRLASALARLPKGIPSALSRVLGALKSAVSAVVSGLEGFARLLKTLAERVGARDVAVEVESAVERAPADVSGLRELVSRLASRISRLPGDVAREVRRLIEEYKVRVKGPGWVREMLTEFLDQLERAAREAEEAARERAVYKYRAVIERLEATGHRIPRSVASFIAAELMRGEKVFTVETPEGTFTARRVFRPNGMGGFDLVYEVRGPEGYWARLVLRTVRRDGFLDVYREITFDPRVEGNPPAASALARALEAALKEDTTGAGTPLYELVSRIGVNTAEGVRELGSYLESAIRVLGALSRAPGESGVYSSISSNLGGVVGLARLLSSYGEELSEELRKALERLGLRSPYGWEYDGIALVFTQTLPAGFRVGYFHVRWGSVEVTLPGVRVDGKVVLIVPVDVLSNLLGATAPQVPKIAPEEVTLETVKVSPTPAVAPQVAVPAYVEAVAKTLAASQPPPPRPSEKPEVKPALPPPPTIPLPGVAGGLAPGAYMVKEVLVV